MSLPRPENKPVWVYVWPTTPASMGHAAIQVGGNAPKVDAKQDGNYISIRPGLPAFGPLGFIPVPAKFSRTLTADKWAEAPNDLSSETTQPNSESNLSPRFTFQFNGLDTTAIEHAIDDMKEDQTRYQLLPLIKTAKVFDFVKPATAGMMMPNPFSEEPNRHITAELERAPKIKYPAFNCTSLVYSLLNKGGAQLSYKPSFWRPWGLTPSALRDVVKKSSAIEIGVGNKKLGS